MSFVIIDNTPFVEHYLDNNQDQIPLGLRLFLGNLPTNFFDSNVQ